jgi:hypothetical protein
MKHVEIQVGRCLRLICLLCTATAQSCPVQHIKVARLLVGLGAVPTNNRIMHLQL